MTQDIQFLQSDNHKWVGSFTSVEGGVVQISRPRNAPLKIEASINGFPPVILHERGSQYARSQDDFMFRLTLPAGLDIVIVSDCEVHQAALYTTDR